jgi:hypothetical protein
MKKLHVVLLAISVLALGFAPAAIAAGRPDAGQPGAPAERWMTPENARHAENGEVVYRCATETHGRMIDAPSKAQIDQWIAENRVAAGGVIPVNFHVIYSSGRRSTEGNIPDSWLDAQIAVLNNTYAGKGYNGSSVPGAANTGYTFFRNSVTRTNNSKWFTMTPGSGNESKAKNALVVNPTGSLNFYTCKPGQNLLGWATFPWNLAGNPNMDGVVIHYNSLPGGTLSPYNLGGTGSHEVGHWVGLYHTFQGGCDGGNCSGAGDLVCDTPGEATATSGCPSGKDTCAEPGVDPIHNYMDYSTDACYNNFTPGQDARADFMMATYRPAIGSARIANAAGRPDAARELGGDLVGLTAKPNPFNPRTKISFGLRRDGHVTLRVYDVQGRLAATLVNDRMTAGNHEVEFNGDRLASGVYMMRLQMPDGVEMTRRVTLMK